MDWIGIVSVALGVPTLVLAILAWRNARPIAPWRVEQLAEGHYKLTRMSIFPARIREITVTHEGPPQTFSHGSGELTHTLFRRGHEEHFKYDLPMTGRRIWIAWSVVIAGRPFKVKREWSAVL